MSSTFVFLDVRSLPFLFALAHDVLGLVRLVKLFSFVLVLPAPCQSFLYVCLQMWFHLNNIHVVKSIIEDIVSTRVHTRVLIKNTYRET